MECIIYEILALGDWYRLMHHCTPLFPQSFWKCCSPPPSVAMAKQNSASPHWKFSDTCRSTILAIITADPKSSRVIKDPEPCGQYSFVAFLRSERPFSWQVRAHRASFAMFIPCAYAVGTTDTMSYIVPGGHVCRGLFQWSSMWKIQMSFWEVDKYKLILVYVLLRYVLPKAYSKGMMAKFLT